MFSTLVLTALCVTAISGHAYSKRGLTTRQPKPLPQSYEVVHSFSNIDFEWTDSHRKEDYVQSGRYIPENNGITGIKVYKGAVYVTVSRFFDGVPASLDEVVTLSNGRSGMRPFPNWEAHTIGDCNDLQFVQSMEIDPNTGLMWVIDSGRSAIFKPSATRNDCPGKLVVYNIKTKKEVLRYTFPEDIVNRTASFLNDLVLDYVNGRVGYVYITDTLNYGLIVYNVNGQTSYRLEDPVSMTPRPNLPVDIDGTPFDPKLGINGIAMSADFRYVYFASIAGLELYQVPTRVLRNPNSNIADAIRIVGVRPSQGDGMVFGKNNLYYGGLNDSTVMRWNVAKDTSLTQSKSEGDATLNTVDAILKDPVTIAWPDTLAIDEEGYLWVTAPDAGRWFLGQLDFSPDAPTNMRIVRTYVGEVSYLSKRRYPITRSTVRSAAVWTRWGRRSNAAWLFPVMYHFICR